MNAKRWIRWFQENREAYSEPDWSQRCPLPAGKRRALIDSLATFQLGETGGGTRLRRFVRAQTRHEPFTEDYRQAVDLFIAEENRHASLLAKAIGYLGGRLRERHWSNHAFRGVRSLINLEFNIQLLLTAELIAEAYYGLLHERSGDPVLTPLCGKIVRDEIMHIGFHAAFFRHRQATWLPVESVLWSLQFQTIFRLVQELVWQDHRSCLGSLGVTRDEFIRRSKGVCRRFLRQVEAGRPERIDEDPMGKRLPGPPLGSPGNQ